MASAATFDDTIEKKGRFVAEHFLNIYPVHLYNDNEKEHFQFHEYTFVKKFKPMNDKEKMMPLIEFKLKFLPFMQNIVVDHKPLSRVIINIFAICGGVFAVFSLIETLIGPGLKYLVDSIL